MHRRATTNNQRAVERIAASVLRVILDARHRRDLANTDADLLRVHRYLAGLTAQAQLERAHAAGRVRPDNPVLQDAARYAARIEQIAPIVATALDRASRTPLTADTVAALLALPPSHQENDQPHQTHTSRPTNPGKPRKKKTNDHLLPLSQHWERGPGGEGPSSPQPEQPAIIDRDAPRRDPP